MKRILLIGSGELGSRFLQAIVKTGNDIIIDIVEPNDSAIEIAKNRILEINNLYDFKLLQFYQNINEIKTKGDLVIIATHSDIRLELFQECIKIGYINFLFEKIVCQSKKDYNTIIELKNSYKLNIWVNCKTRCYPIWNYIKSKIINTKFTFSSIGGNHGICTNGLHTIDLFVYLSNSDKLFVKNINIDNYLHLTKRNKFDLSGNISMEDENLNYFEIKYSKDNLLFPLDIIQNNQYRWIVDNSTRQAYESFENNTFREIDFKGDLSVSSMSVLFINQILLYNYCDLPSIEETQVSHNFIFDISLPIFNKLLNKTDDICPIT
jgi:hypothetical protein